MKLSINKNTLESAILLCNTYVEKRDSSTITSYLFSEADEDKLIIRASDPGIGINYKIRKIRVESGRFATANAKSIADVIKSLDSEEVVSEIIDNFLFIRQKSTRYRLPMFNHEDFPNFPETESKNQFDIDSGDLGKSLKKILPSIGTNSPRYSLSGAFLDIKTDRINFIGTDARHLAIYTLEKTNNQEFYISIPKKAIMEMQKLFYEKIEVYYDENMLIAKNDNFEFFAKLINDESLDYKKVIPKTFKQELKFSTEDSIDNLKEISAVAEKMKLHSNEGRIISEGISLDNMEARTELEIETGISEEFSLNIKIKYLLDFLTSIGEEQFTLSMNGPDLAFVTNSQGLSMVIMPMIL